MRRLGIIGGLCTTQRDPNSLHFAEATSQVLAITYSASLSNDFVPLLHLLSSLYLIYLN